MPLRRVAVTLLTGAVLAAASAAAGDLTVPPELRPGAVVTHEPARAPRRAEPDVRATRSRAPRPPSPDGRTVDVGVTLRGGSGTPRLVAPLGNAQAVRESGSAFGAAMRFGF